MDLNKTRLERAHIKLHSEIARLVSPPFSATPEELAAIEPLIKHSADALRDELLEDEGETVEFLKRNRLEIENFFPDMIEHFNSQTIRDAIYNYYARNFPGKTREEIEDIIKRKCN